MKLNTIFAHLATLSLYGGFYYQFTNPAGQYVHIVEKYAILYSILTTIAVIMISVGILGMYIVKQDIIKTTYSEKEKKAIKVIQKSD